MTRRQSKKQRNSRNLMMDYGYLVETFDKEDGFYILEEAYTNKYITIDSLDVNKYSYVTPETIQKEELTEEDHKMLELFFLNLRLGGEYQEIDENVYTPYKGEEE